MANWEWDTDTDLTRKKCKGCGGAMMIDRASAIKYQGDSWHCHCLLDMLTETKPISAELTWGGMGGI